MHTGQNLCEYLVIDIVQHGAVGIRTLAPVFFHGGDSNGRAVCFYRYSRYYPLVSQGFIICHFFYRIYRPKCYTFRCELF